MAQVFVFVGDVTFRAHVQIMQQIQAFAPNFSRVEDVLLHIAMDVLQIVSTGSEVFLWREMGIEGFRA